jgi:hypothetical protein
MAQVGPQSIGIAELAKVCRLFQRDMNNPETRMTHRVVESADLRRRHNPDLASNIFPARIDFHPLASGQEH